MEKKVTDYFSQEGFEWKKEDGVLNVKRSGVNFRVFLQGEKDMKSTFLWIQYATQLEEDLSKIHWAGQTVIVNVLNDRHPALNVSMNTEDHVLWVHYRADIHSQKEFAFHFDGAYSEMQSLMKDYSELLPKVQSDFTMQQKEQRPIGFT
ncbi:MAG: hypothetical protein ACI4VS_00020 [Candidatus Nanosyncoccaceae bacterium]